MKIEYEAFCGIDGECETGFSTQQQAETWLSKKLLSLNATAEQIEKSYVLKSIPSSVGTVINGIIKFKYI